MNYVQFTQGEASTEDMAEANRWRYTEGLDHLDLVADQKRDRTIRDIKRMFADLRVELGLA